MSDHQPPRLQKHRSWSLDIQRNEEWVKMKINQRRRRLIRSVSDEDLKELRACFELGFGFDSLSPDFDPKLSRAFPALDLYRAVNKQYSSRLSRSSSSISSDSSDSSLSTIFDPSDDSETVKRRLKQWAHVVACSVLQASPTIHDLNFNQEERERGEREGEGEIEPKH